MKQSYKNKIENIFYLIIIFSVSQVTCHGRLRDPPSRSTLWRFPEFKHLKPPKNYNDNGSNCGGYFEQYNVQGGKCGECGDPYNAPKPRANEDGGLYGRGIIVRNYTSGDDIPIFVELTANHKGYFEFRLCPRKEPNLPIHQDCFDKYLLSLANGYGNGTKYIVQSGIRNFNFKLKLPQNVKCTRCVLQWHYRAGNNWGKCENGRGALGCGPQEIFRACSDIAIY